MLALHGDTSWWCRHDPWVAHTTCEPCWAVCRSWALSDPCWGQQERRRKDQKLWWSMLLSAGSLFCLLQKLEVANQPKKRRRKDYLMVKMVECCLGKLIVFLSFATFFSFVMLVNSLQPNFSQTVTNWVFFNFFMVHLKCRGLNLYSQLLPKTILDT